MLDKVRVIADLPLGSIELLRQGAQRRGSGLVEVVRQAVALDSRLRDQQNAGNAVFWRTREGSEMYLRADRPRDAGCSSRIRVIADLPLGSIELLRRLATRDCVSLTAALRGAIATQACVETTLAPGEPVRVQDPTGYTRELWLNLG